MLPLVCVSHPSPATYWILQSLSLRYGNGRLSESCQACPYSVTSALHSKSGTCPLNPRHETAYHRCGFRDSVDPIILRYRRYSGCHPDPTSISSSLLLQEPSRPSVLRGRRGPGTARAVLHACPCSFWNWRLEYYSTS